ncbi:hypothetical protein M885DRAFT_566941 [Pelagophyceae sp. CCMP2097]|nr:hypothetical protein M885DRAFT_566941 [Pelagophyceae sp. CCMP2097]
MPRYGLDKVAVLLNAQAGKVFAVGLDTGAVLWSRIVPVGCTLLAASATHVALFQPPLKTLFLDAISGAATEGAAPDVDHVIPTPLSCEGQKVYVAFTASEILAGNGTASVVPLQAYAAVSDMLTAHPLHFHLLRAGTLRCFCVDASFKAHSLGSVNIAIGHEKLVAHAYADKDEPNNKNKAQVLGDDALLLKYQNPHLAVFITADAGGSDSPFADYKAQNDDGTAPQTLRVTLASKAAAV